MDHHTHRTSRHVGMLVTILLLLGALNSATLAADRKPLPKTDVVDVPAIGHGLCVSNVFQSNMERRIKEAEAVIAELKPKVEKYDNEKKAAAAKAAAK